MTESQIQEIYSRLDTLGSEVNSLKLLTGTIGTNQVAIAQILNTQQYTLKFSTPTPNYSMKFCIYCGIAMVGVAYEHCHHDPGLVPQRGIKN